MRRPELRRFARPPAAPPGPVRELLICTGNVCRSPYGQRRLAAGFEDLTPGCFQIESAGTAALVDDPADPHLDPMLRAHGLGRQEHRARQLTERMLTTVDVVLTSTVAQRTQVLALRPALLRRTFTLLEFAWLLERHSAESSAESRAEGRASDPAESEAAASCEQPHPGSTVADTRRRWQQLPGLLGSRRSAAAGETLDVADPYGRGPEAFARMVEEMDPALEAVMRWEETQRGRG